MIDETFHGKLVKKREGMYTLYVFQKDNGEYIMCTRLPNWDAPILQTNDTGYCKVRTILEGESYYFWKEDIQKKYKYSNIYFMEFIKDKKEQQDVIIQ